MKETLALKLEQSANETVEVAKAVEAQEQAGARGIPMRPPRWRDKLLRPGMEAAVGVEAAVEQKKSGPGGRRGTKQRKQRFSVVTCTLTQRRKTAIQEGVTKFHFCVQHFQHDDQSKECH